MEQNKWTKIAFLLLGITCLISGVYHLYMALGGEAKQEDQRLQESAVFLGEAATNVDGVEFCVTSVTDTQMVGSDYLGATTENNYIVVSIKITNNSNEPYDVNTLRYLLTENDHEYQYCEDAILAFDNHMFMDTINPALSKEYTIVYEVPYTSAEKDWQMKILDNIFSNRDCVYINLRKK